MNTAIPDCVLAACICGFAMLALAGSNAPPTIIDADTIEIAGERIRLWGIDAPEPHKPHGPAATAALTARVEGKTVTCQPREADRYGRTVATCSVDGEDLGEWLVRKGWARDWPRYSGGAYADAEKSARREQRGLWR